MEAEKKIKPEYLKARLIYGVTIAAYLAVQTCYVV
jgi:hypothetical protein